MVRDQMKMQEGSCIKCAVIESSTADVYFLQRGCSDHFRRTGEPLQSLTQKLQEGSVDPLKEKSLILDAALANIRQQRDRRLSRRVVYYSLDHRRLKCMKEARQSFG